MMIGKIKKFWNYVVNIGVDLENGEFSIISARLLNQFTFITTLVFLIHSLHNYFYIQDAASGIFLLCMSLFFAFTFRLNKFRRIKFLVFLAIVLLILTVFFYESYSGIKSGVYLYYFPILLSAPFIFDFKRDKIYIIFIALIILASGSINFFTNYTLFLNPDIPDESKRSVFLISLSISTFILLIDLCFIMSRNQMLDDLLEANSRKQRLLQEKEKLIKSLEEEKNKIEKEEFKEIMRLHKYTQLATSNESLLFAVFNEMYPDYYNEILSYAPDLTVLELEIIMYMRLNFTTKEMALFSKSSVKDIEERRYRIQRKLRLNAKKKLINLFLI